MKLLILSDSHGDLEYMRLAMTQERPDYVIHLGDHNTDADRLGRLYPQVPLVSVPGNCDFSFQEPEVRMVEYGGLRLLFTHGHRHGVNGSLLRLLLAARENEVDAALFGHTHQPYCAQENGIWLINPGSCTYPDPTCAVVTIENKQLACTIRHLR